MKIIKSGAILFMLLLTLTACSERDNKSESNVENKEESSFESKKEIEKEYVLKPEDGITFRVNKRVYSRYFFNGFVNSETIAFNYSNSSSGRTIYQPAVVGHTFEFKYIEDYEFSIVEVNRSENYIKLKATEINTIKENDGN